jgi:putative sigma-54 modulation protein
MFEEDAVTAMEELGHDFYVFVNAENERVSVLYRRRDGDYGLIEPAVGGEYTPSRKGAASRASR